MSMTMTASATATANIAIRIERPDEDENEDEAPAASPSSYAGGVGPKGGPASSSSSSDKSLKMKIKRMKSGARGNAEGKLEIVQQSEAADEASTTPTNGSPDPIGLSAAEIVAAVKQNVKTGVNIAIGTSNSGGGKVRLTSSSATGSRRSPAPTRSGRQGRRAAGRCR